MTREEFEKKEKEKEKTKMERANTEGLILKVVFTNYGTSIAGLPKKYKEYEKALIEFLEWGNCEIIITLENLLKEIEKIKNKIKTAKENTKNKENEKIKTAKIEAKKERKNITIKHEIVDWDSEDEGDVVCKDTYVTPGGEIKILTYHTY